MKQQGLLVRFLIRWGVSTLGLWIAMALLGPDRLSVGDSWLTWVGAGFFLALINMLLKPILIFLSIPALLLTLGLFMLVLNGVLIIIADWIYGPLEVSGLGSAVIAGIIIGLVNFLVTHIVEDFAEK
jgi:putative membrane protein